MEEESTVLEMNFNYSLLVVDEQSTSDMQLERILSP